MQVHMLKSRNVAREIRANLEVNNRNLTIIAEYES